ncbi:hypothetical protein [Mycobacterium sp. shizuoka-1]|uniref:hypothetical protein n=1 Tax=Mycobacterium sp. shizuoka-1 TaxID=2039281 RepID=UPI000C067816|nr:hypothetical protein [Mycobacterium sp. shizuoka-1]GAY14699.1 hypothetical protein MSZK_14250 [Mycobacterium sp. shizuoka-1]
MAQWTVGAHARIVLAIAGGGAMVAMAGLAVAVDASAPPQIPPVASPVLPGPMTQGDTVTTTIPPTALATEKAVVTHKAKPYKG